jgi:hypothetical protein
VHHGGDWRQLRGGVGVRSRPAVTYSGLTLSATNVDEKEQLVVSVTVANTGLVEAEHSALLFLFDIYRRVTPEYKLIKRFEKQTLGPGSFTRFSWALGRHVHPLQSDAAGRLRPRVRVRLQSVRQRTKRCECGCGGLRESVCGRGVVLELCELSGTVRADQLPVRFPT